MNQSSKAEHVFGTVGGSELIVDGFKFRPRAGAAAAYVLTHCHADHTAGLDEHFPWGLGCRVFMTDITAALTMRRLGLDPAWVVAVPLDTPVRVLPDVVVTFVSANHCPGSAVLVIEYTPAPSAGTGAGAASPPSPIVAVHTGDFRYSAAVHGGNAVLAAAARGQLPSVALRDAAGQPVPVLNPLGYAVPLPSPSPLAPGRGCDALYLDTTYAHPRHALPEQEDSIRQAATVVRGLQRHADDPRLLADTLVLASAYVIGKERLILGLSGCGDGDGGERLSVYVSPSKLALLQRAGLDPAALAVFTTDRASASIHVVGMGLCGKTWPYFQPDYPRVAAYAQALNAMQRSGNSNAGSSSAASTSGAASSGNDGVPRPDLDDSDEAEEDAFVAAALGGGSDVGGEGAEAAPPRYRRVIGIVPTGWVHTSKRKVFTNAAGGGASPGDDEEEVAVGQASEQQQQQMPVSLHLVAYSEHSSFAELRAAVALLRPRRLIPTVYRDAKDREAIVKRFSDLTDATAAKRAFLATFGGGASGGSRGASAGGFASAAGSSSSTSAGAVEAAVAGDDIVEVLGDAEDGSLRAGAAPEAATASPPPAKRPKKDNNSSKGIAAYFSPASGTGGAGAGASSTVVELLDDE